MYKSEQLEYEHVIVFCLTRFLPSVALVDAARVLAMQHQSSKAHILCQSAIQLLSDGPSACGHTTEQWALCQY